MVSSKDKNVDDEESITRLPADLKKLWCLAAARLEQVLSNVGDGQDDSGVSEPPDAGPEGTRPAWRP